MGSWGVNQEKTLLLPITPLFLELGLSKLKAVCPKT
jgi:hypothetical protein